MKILLTVSVAFLLLGASPVSSQSLPRDSEVRVVPPVIVDGPTARDLVASGARLVDVREPAEFEVERIDGAINIPVGEIAYRAEEIGPPNTPVVVYCRSGRRSALAASILSQMGWTQVYDLGAMTNWWN